MATAEDVQRALRTLMQNLDSATVDRKAVPDRTLVCICPDVPVAFRAELRGGKLQDLLEVEGNHPGDVRISARSDDLIALIDGRLNVGFAFLMGKIKVDASTADLMMIRQLF